MNYIALDVETTGFSPDSCELLEIGAWKVENGVTVSAFKELIKPTGYIPTHITAINGITNEMVRNADSLDTVLTEFYDFCEDYPLLAHNLPFDWGFIHTKGKNLGLDFSKNCTRLGIDTLDMSRKYVGSKVSSHKLGKMAEYYSIKVDVKNSRGFHSADYDAYVCHLLYQAIVKEYKLDEKKIAQLIIAPTGADTQYGEVKNNETLSLT